MGMDSQPIPRGWSIPVGRVVPNAPKLPPSRRVRDNPPYREQNPTSAACPLSSVLRPRRPELRHGRIAWGRNALPGDNLPDGAEKNA